MIKEKSTIDMTLVGTIKITNDYLGSIDEITHLEMTLFFTKLISCCNRFPLILKKQMEYSFSIPGLCGR